MPDSKRPDTIPSASIEIRSSKLTSCSVLDKGDTVVLGLLNSSGASVSLKLSFDQAQSIVMTLPHVLTRALRLRTGSPASRYVFPTDTWTLEGADGNEILILTLKTSDGFEASFGIPFDVCRSLAQSLGREAGSGNEPGGWTQ